MKRNLRAATKRTLTQKLSSAFALGGLALLGLAGTPASAQNTAPPFEEAAYLYTQATDTDNFGYGDWLMYKNWLNVPQLGVETDPGGQNDWYAMSEGFNNQNWGNQQTRYGTGVLPDVLLGIGSMPWDPDSSEQNQGGGSSLSLQWEDSVWQAEANNDPNYMQYFTALGKNIVDQHYKSVIIRLDYEFDGFWNSYGNLSKVSGMPNNFISAWQHTVDTVRQAVKDENAATGQNVSVKFCWNPTDKYVQVDRAQYYPGDGYVDYIGIDSYDDDDSGIYQAGVDYGKPDGSGVSTQQNAWTTSIQPRLKWFTDLARADNTGRNGYIATGTPIPLIVGEWGLWGVGTPNHNSGGDNPVYIQNMYDWMSSNNVYMESYFETNASDGSHQLWPGGYPTPNSGNPAWSMAVQFPRASKLYQSLFGASSSPATVLPIGHRIGIKSQQTGYFASSDQGDSTFLKSLWSTSPGTWETFDVADAGNGNIALLCEQTGKYVSADLNQAYGVNDGAPFGVLRADWATSFGSWETFQPVDQGSGVFGLKANNGLYVSCNLNDGNRLDAPWAQSIGAWEQFTYTDLGTDGSLIATDPPVTGTVSLSTFGTTDWAHWGCGSVGHLDHKAVSGVAVGKIKATLPSGAAAFTTTGAAYSWTGGTPTSAATASATGVSTTTGTFTLTVPISKTKQTLSIYVGGANSLGMLKAAASDHSSRPYLDQVGSMKGVYNEVYTIAVAAGQPGQTLTVTWKRTQGTGTVALEAAALHQRD